MEFSFTKGKLAAPQRVLVYGPEGIGKSTFAAAMPAPVFIDVENGTGHLDVTRLEPPTSWGMLLREVRFVVDNAKSAATIVVDTADAAERLCQQAVCLAQGKQGIEDFGYGKGYTYARDEFCKLLDELDAAVGSGFNCVLTAHSTMRKFERPDESGAYDRFELKCHKAVAAAVKEWADAVLFCDYETFVSRDESGRAKASGGKRVIRTSHHVTWDAKNRWGLPEKLPLDESGCKAVAAHLMSREDASEDGGEEEAALETDKEG